MSALKKRETNRTAKTAHVKTARQMNPQRALTRFILSSRRFAAKTMYRLSLLGAFTALAATSSWAQVVAPMNKSIDSFSDKFMVQITIRNPYKAAQISEIEMFDENWVPVKTGYLSKRRTLLGAGQTMTITAMVPFGNKQKKHVYICHAITPRAGGRGSSYRGEVCGKYTARRLSV